MDTNAFIGRTEAPTDADLETELGPSKPLWDQLVAELLSDLKLEVEGWKSYSPKYGWSYRLARGKRRIVYIVPSHGKFEATFILGDKAIKAAHESKLPKKALQLIDAGQRYPEGTGVRVEVKSARDVAIVEKLAAVKLAN